MRSLPFALRVAEPGDAAALTQLERAAFPSMVAGTPFRQELKRDSTYYLVATGPTLAATGTDRAETPEPVRPTSLWLFGLIRRLLSSNANAEPRRDTSTGAICGVVGLWFMVDECHVVVIATSHSERRRGLGERLLIGGIDEALRRNSRVVTLEVRASNHAARALYRKYLFADAGMRKRYYSDNNEDAIIMTTPHIQDAEFVDQFQALVKAHAARWGAATSVTP